MQKMKKNSFHLLENKKKASKIVEKVKIRCNMQAKDENFFWILHL